MTIKNILMPCSNVPKFPWFKEENGKIYILDDEERREIRDREFKEDGLIADYERDIFVSDLGAFVNNFNNLDIKALRKMKNIMVKLVKKGYHPIINKPAPQINCVHQDHYERVPYTSGIYVSNFESLLVKKKKEI